MDQGYQCIECAIKDETIRKLKMQLEELQGKQYCSEVQIMDIDSPVRQSIGRNDLMKSVYETNQGLFGPHCKQSEVQSPPIKRGETLESTPAIKQITRCQTIIQSVGKQDLGNKFFESFLVIGPNLAQLPPIDGDEEQVEVEGSILFKFPPSDVDDDCNILPQYVFPNNIVVRKVRGTADTFKNDVVPQIKEIVMQTLQSNKGENEFIITLPREDILSKSKKQATQFVVESNPNVFRYVICYQIDDFYCPDKQTYSYWRCPIIYCFVSYHPFIKFFMKENTTFWNELKIDRISPLCNDDKEALQMDIRFLIQQLKQTFIEKLFSLRSISVDFDTKYKIEDKSNYIQSPKKDRAKFIQFQWGANKTFHLLSLKELIFIMSHVLLSYKVILFSTSKSTLCHVMLTVLSLMQPFEYPMPLAFLLHKDLYDKIGALCPIFFGVNDNYVNVAESLSHIQDEDLVYFDLDEFSVNYTKQSRNNFKKYIPPIKKYKDIRQQYYSINPSKHNRFEKNHKDMKVSLRLDRGQSIKFKEQEIEICKQFQSFWMTNVVQNIPVDRKYLKSDSNLSINLKAISEAIANKCPKKCRDFVIEFIQQPVFTSFLDQLYENNLINQDK